MSRAAQPKQLIPFIDGQSLLDIAFNRLEGLVKPQHRFICAGKSHRAAILKALPQITPDQYLAEPIGRDTLNAVGFAAAVIAKQDPNAIIAVFTADHIIEPIDQFQHIVEHGFSLVEQDPTRLVTFGIQPTHPATGYGYLKLGRPIGEPNINAKRVDQFKEKPNATTAEQYLAAGPEQYLWNSGMFVWNATTLLECIKRYQPENHNALTRIVDQWDTPQRDQTLDDIYPTLPKVSVDYAIMEPASTDPAVTVAAIPMPLRWLDVGSWPSFAETRPRDQNNNAIAAEKHILLNTTNTLVVSQDPDHLITTIGCDNLIIIHTPRATLVCHADQAEQIKALHKSVGESFGPEML